MGNRPSSLLCSPCGAVSPNVPQLLTTEMGLRPTSALQGSHIPVQRAHSPQVRSKGLSEGSLSGTGREAFSSLGLPAEMTKGFGPLRMVPYHMESADPLRVRQEHTELREVERKKALVVFSKPLKPARPETRPLWGFQSHKPVHSLSFHLSGSA